MQPSCNVFVYVLTTTHGVFEAKRNQIHVAALRDDASRIEGPVRPRPYHKKGKAASGTETGQNTRVKAPCRSRTDAMTWEPPF